MLAVDPVYHASAFALGPSDLVELIPRLGTLSGVALLCFPGPLRRLGGLG